MESVTRLARAATVRRLSRALRSAASGPGWHEVFIDSGAGSSAEPHSAVALGCSVLVLEAVGTPAECVALRSEASAFAAAWRAERRTEDVIMEHPVHAKAVREPVLEMLGVRGQELCDSLLLRAIARANGSLPPLVPVLDLADACGADTCLHNPALAFTPGEPAINVYAAGGLFTAHQDNQALTVLLPLSDGGAFAGGGTAFWPPGGGALASETGRAAHAQDEPAAVLRPPAGTALLFAGSVMHSGMPVDSGERVVLVASLSRASLGLRAERALLSFFARLQT